MPIILFATAWLLHCRHARAEVVARRGGAEAHLRFVQMLVNNGIANGHRFLTQKSIGAMASNQIGFLPIAGYPPMGLPPESAVRLRCAHFVQFRRRRDHPSQGAFGWDGIGTRRMWVLRDQHIAILVWVPLIRPAAAPLQRIVESAVMRAIEPR